MIRQVKLRFEYDDGDTEYIYPVTSVKDVEVGKLSSGELSLPGNSDDEILETTLGNIRKYLENLSELARIARTMSDSVSLEDSDVLATSKAVATVEATLEEAQADIENIFKVQLPSKAPVDHSYTDTTYGAATSEKYGHVTLSDSYKVEVDKKALVVTQQAVVTMYNDLMKVIKEKMPNAHADAIAATYGAGTSSMYGHVRLTDKYDSATALTGTADDSLGASAYALCQAYQANEKRIAALENALVPHYHDERYLKLTGTTWENADTANLTLTGAMSGYILFKNTGTTNGVGSGIGGIVATNDSWVVRGYQTRDNVGALEIAVGDDGNEGIYARQYVSGGYKQPFTHLAGGGGDLGYRQITLMEPNTGYTSLLQLGVTNNVTIGGTLGVTGPTTLSTLTTGNVNINGILNLKGGVTDDSYTGALNLSNSNICGINSLYTSDVSENGMEGLHFYRDDTHVDTIWVNSGNIYFVPNRQLGVATAAADSNIVLHSGNFNNWVPTKTGTGASGTWGISVSGNAATATKLQTTRTISIAGAVTGSGTFDGSGDLTISTSVNHTHNYAGSSSAGGEATSALKVSYRGRHTETASGTDANGPTTGMLYTSSMYMTGTYNDSATPISYGNIINLAGEGTGQLLCGWSGTDNVTEHLWYRSHRDTSTGGWGTWKKIAYVDDNVASASKLATARKITLSGDITGSGSFDGSGDLTITTSNVGGGSYIGDTAPSNTKLLWIDTGNGGVMKYWNGSAWTATKAVWG